MTRIDALPDALEHWPDLLAEVRGQRLVVFVDFDGTLAPIVDDPTAARLPAVTREALVRLHRRCWVVVVSGRDADDVRDRVALEGLIYAGSHGFDVLWPDGRRVERGTEFVDRLRAAHQALVAELADVPGVELEPKRFAVAVHHRRVDEARSDEVRRAVTRVADAFPDLRMTGGKQVLELRPDIDWDKGRATLALLSELGLTGGDVRPVYLGDDLTDEDAFAALDEHGRGLGLLVRGEADDRRTRARFTVAGVEAAGEVLRRLAAEVAGPP